VPRPNAPRQLGGEDSLARRVAFERERRGWTTESLAKRMTDAGCPINQSAIWKIESGRPRRRITYDEALAFAEVFEIPLAEITLPPEVVIETAVRELFVEYAKASRVHQDALQRLRELHRYAMKILDRFPEARPVLDRLLDPATDPPTATRATGSPHSDSTSW